MFEFAQSLCAQFLPLVLKHLLRLHYASTGSTFASRLQHSSIMKTALPLPHKAKKLVRSTSMYRSYDRKRMIKEWRFAACALLAFSQTPSALWFEDVLEFHGGDETDSELYLVVDSPQESANILMQHGYQQINHPKFIEFRAGPLGNRDIYLTAPGAATPVIFLPADEWHYDLRLDELHDYKCPWMPRFLDSLMEYWLKVPPSEYEARRTQMDYIAQIVVQCYARDDFGEQIGRNKYGRYFYLTHLELHFDIVSRCRGIVQQPFDFQERHAYHTRKFEQIKAGKFVPRPYKRGRYHPALPPLLERIAEDGIHY